VNLEKRIAIVTGGMGELGKEIVNAFHLQGATVAIPVRSAAPTSQAGGTDPQVIRLQADLTVESQVRAFFQTVEERFGTIGFLVNAAGGFSGGTPVEETELADLEQMLSLNLRTAFLACKFGLQEMRKRNFGRIVNISAMAAVNPVVKRSGYAIAKRGVISLTESIAEEVKGSGITANAIAPSIIDTEANRRSMPGADIRRWVPPQEIAELVLFLCSDAARSMNGNVIKIFGGV
jgi:NAD(P)-dependent dehydrogenase (short-subunit alcohol dehydrogenase family)